MNRIFNKNEDLMKISFNGNILNIDGYNCFLKNLDDIQYHKSQRCITESDMCKIRNFIVGNSNFRNRLHFFEIFGGYVSDLNQRFSGQNRTSIKFFVSSNNIIISRLPAVSVYQGKNPFIIWMCYKSCHSISFPYKTVFYSTDSYSGITLYRYMSYK